MQTDHLKLNLKFNTVQKNVQKANDLEGIVCTVYVDMLRDTNDTMNYTFLW